MSRRSSPLSAVNVGSPYQRFSTWVQEKPETMGAWSWRIEAVRWDAGQAAIVARACGAPA